MASFSNCANSKIHQDQSARLSASRIGTTPALMAMAISRLAVVSSLLLASPAYAAAPSDEAQQAASNFFLAYMTLRQQDQVTGLPSMQQLDTLSPYFIPKLHRIFYIALREQHRCRSRGKTTPWAEGDIFSSGNTGFNSFKVAPSITNQYGRQAKVSFTLQQNGKTLSWDDEVIMRRENGAWLIYDIEYHGQFARNKSGKSLQSVIDKNPAC